MVRNFERFDALEGVHRERCPLPPTSALMSGVLHTTERFVRGLVPRTRDPEAPAKPGEV
jgi:hypothetical protein